MSFLSAPQLAKMRADVAKMLPDTCTIYSRTEVVSDAGDVILGEWTLVGSVKCRLDPLSRAGAVSVVGGQEVFANAYQLTVPHDAPLAKNNQVEIDGKRYEIVALYDEHSWRVSRRAIVVLVE